jgi:hypothetical protein
MDMWTISRRVVPSVPGAPNFPSGFLAAMGEAAQVPTQWSVGEAAAAMEGASAQRESRRTNEILTLIDMAFLGWNMIGSRLHLIVLSCRCFVEERGLTYSGEGRTSADNFAAKHGRR